mgnify:CR=1 FL=1
MSDVDVFFFFFQAEDGIRYLVRSRGLGDVYKRQMQARASWMRSNPLTRVNVAMRETQATRAVREMQGCLLYTSDAADERSSVDLGGRRIIKKKKQSWTRVCTY